MIEITRRAARSAFLGALACCVLGLAACSAGTPTAAPTPGPVTQDLTMSGAIAGKLTTASTATCSVNNHANSLTTPLTVDITGTVSGRTVNVTFRIDSYIGPGNYEGQRLGDVITGAAVTDSANTDSTAQLQSSTGEIAVAKNGSGTVNMTMGQQSVKGSWRCR